MITFRRGTADDTELYMELEQRISNHMYVGTLDSEEMRRNLERNVVYFVEEEGKVLGCIEYGFTNKDHAHIWGLIILEIYQGRGIGKQTLLKVLHDLETIKTIDLVVHPENKKALGLYQSVGFKIVDRKEDYFGDGEPRLVLEKRLP